MRLDEALVEIAPVLGLKPRQVCKPRVTVDEANKKIYLRPSRGARLMELIPEAVPGLLKQASIPDALVKKVSPTTFANVATEALGDCTLLVRDEQVIDVAPARQYEYIDPRRVMATIDKAIPNVDINRVLTLLNHTVRLETIGIEEKAVSAGDLVRAGALIQFSPIGITKPLVQSFVVRLACTNGVTSNDVLREFSFSDGNGNLWSWFRHSIKDAYGSVNAIVNRFQAMINQEIAPEHRASVLAGLLRGASIRGNDAEAIRAEALANPPANAYDMVNLLTWGSSHVITEPVRIARAEQTASRFIEATEHRELCPTCRRWLS